MPTTHAARVRRSIIQGALALVLLCFTVLVSGCGGNASAQQQASQQKAQLDSLLQHAQTIGVPAASLASIRAQEQQISSTSAPFALFNDQLITDYNRNLASRYQQLLVQTRGVIAVSTSAAQQQAHLNLQHFQTTLAQRQAQGLPVQNFTQQFHQEQSLMASAQYPKDYNAVSSKAQTALQSLNMMQDTSAQLATFKSTISQMQTAHIDVSAMQAQYQSDQQALASASNPSDLQQLNTLLNAQYQQAIVSSTAAVPFVTAAKLSELETQLTQLKHYGFDANAYQKRLEADRAMTSQVATLHDYLMFSKQVDADIAAIHGKLLQGQATALVKQFHQEVESWSNAHLFHDSFDGQNYSLVGGYQAQGVGSDIDNDLAAASTPSDFQGMVDEANNALFNLHMLEADYNDHTAYNQVHATDQQMISHYHLQNKQVLMVSMVEQAMRVYQNGKLVNAFQVTTGREELPAVPGVWPVLDRESPTIFKSSEPKTSPYWYPDTPIHYAIMYHQGGYFVHDSWWRADYGPGTQFPHYDSGGDESFAGNGSHGCVNMQEDQAQWVYDHTDWNTLIVIY